jgi:hypothetical protein
VHEQPKQSPSERMHVFDTHCDIGVAHVLPATHGHNRSPSLLKKKKKKKSVAEIRRC